MVGTGASFGTRNASITTIRRSPFPMQVSDSIVCAATPLRRKSIRLLMLITSKDSQASLTVISSIFPGLLRLLPIPRRRRLLAPMRPTATKVHQRADTPRRRWMLSRQLELLKQNSASTSASGPDPKFVAFFNSISPVPLGKVQKLPGETFDHVFPQPLPSASPAPSPNPNQFLTSDSCMGCHSGGTYGNVMLYTGGKQPDGSTPTMNVSPFGEWRWSPMGLAGRDPIFYAQLESEIAFVKSFFKNDPAKIEEKTRTINNTCFKCHGVMGKRRLDDDHGGPDKGNFDPAFVYSTYETNPGNKQANLYGALARDGVSCMACHRIVEDKLAKDETDPLTSFLKNNITGNFTVGGADQIFGPFKDDEIVTDPMNNALGIKPKHDAYIKKSRMCGNCHTINLPLMDNPTLNPGKPHLEQVTYLEWLNSGYQDEYGNNPRARDLPGLSYGDEVQQFERDVESSRRSNNRSPSSRMTSIRRRAIDCPRTRSR